MPEWPEMEHYRRMLEPRMAQRIITNVNIQRARSINVPVETFQRVASGATVTRVERIAKQLVFHLDSGSYMLLHLMLGGWIFYGSDEERPDRTVQVQLELGTQSLYCINLRLGYMHLLTDDERKAAAAKVGPDPFDSLLTPDRLHQILSKKRTTLKAALTDQSMIAGIGNCYSDEICFAAGIKPTRSCAQLEREDSARLLASMRQVLLTALQHGGYMDHPLYVNDSLTGGYDARCQVYDRQGEACVRCGNPIVLETVRSRKTYYCMNCQR